MMVEAVKAPETNKKETFTCFRLAKESELQKLQAEGFLTRANQNRIETLTPTEVQMKLENVFITYFSDYVTDIYEKLILQRYPNTIEFLTKSIELVTGLKEDEAPIVKRIASGNATPQEIRLFFATYGTELFNIALQTSTTNLFSNFISLSFGSPITVGVPDGDVLIELEIPKDRITVDPASRNPMEKEVLVEKIEAEWVKGIYRTQEEVRSMLQNRTDLPVSSFLKDVDMNSSEAVRQALDKYKSHPLNNLID